MKNSELRKIIYEYKQIKSMQNKGKITPKLIEKLKDLEHRYYHETGKNIE